MDKKHRGLSGNNKGKSQKFFEKIVQKKNKEKREIIPRQDGSIVVINYDQFNKLISERCYMNNHEFLQANCSNDFENLEQKDKDAFNYLMDNLNRDTQQLESPRFAGYKSPKFNFEETNISDSFSKCKNADFKSDTEFRIGGIDQSDIENQSLINDQEIRFNEEIEPNNQEISAQESQILEINGLTIRGANKILTFDKVIQDYTFNSEREFSMQGIYQTFSFLIVIIGIISSNPIYYGLQFLTAEPKEYECFKTDDSLDQMMLPDWMTKDNQINKISHWVACEIQEICRADSRYQRDKSLYRLSDTQLSNWADRDDFACNNFQFAGYYFKVAILSGVILALLFVPSIADKFGRKSIFCLSFAVSLISQFGLLVGESHQLAFALLVVMGLTWPGKVLVGLTFILDFYPASLHRYYTYVFLVLNGVSLVFLPIYYDQISKDYYPLQAICLVMTFCTFCYTMLFLPESPWSEYQAGNYQRTREIFQVMSKMNGQDIRLLCRFKDETQQQFNNAIYRINNRNEESPYSSQQSTTPGTNRNIQQILQPSQQSSNEQQEIETEQEMSQSQFIMNLLRMTNLCSSINICIFMSMVILRSVNGEDTTNINFELELKFYVMIMIAAVIGPLFYMIIGFQKSISLFLLLSLISGTGILYITERNHEFYRLQHSQRALMMEQRQFKAIITSLIYGSNILLFSSQTVHFMSCFCEIEIFPRYKRLSSIGFCYLFGFAIVPIIGQIMLMVGEKTKIDIISLSGQKPISIYLGVLALSIINIATFYVSIFSEKQKEFEFEENDEQKEKLIKN